MRINVCLAILLIAFSVFPETALIDTLPPIVRIVWPDTGEYVSCDSVIVELYIWDDFRVDRHSLMLTVFARGEVRSLLDSMASIIEPYYYFPLPFTLRDGDSVGLIMNPVADYNRNTSEGFNWFFWIDLRGPDISAVMPSPGSSVPNPRPPISATLTDISGITRDSSYIIIEGDTFSLTSPAVSWFGDRFTFDPALAGLFFAGGTVVDVCIVAADRATGCGHNISDSCFSFSIPTGGPSAALIRPFSGAWVSCPESTVIFRIADADGIEEDSIKLVFGVETLRTSDPRLTWSSPFLYFDIRGFADRMYSGTLFAFDVLGNGMTPPLSFTLGIDTRSPVLFGASPGAGAPAFTLDPVVRFSLSDAHSGVYDFFTLVGVSVDGSSFSWFTLYDRELTMSAGIYTLDSTAIPPLHGGDTVTIAVLAYDSVTFCGLNRLDTSWSFYIPETPPFVELILPRPGTISACNRQGVWYRISDPEGIRENSINLRVLGTTYTTASPQLSFSRDTLRFEPTTPWMHGSHISGALVSVRDNLDNNITAPVPFNFYVDLEGPRITSYSPPHLSLSNDTLQTVRIRLEDLPAGINPASIRIRAKSVIRSVDGTSLIWEPPYLTYNPRFAGAWNLVDTVEFCLVDAADTPDTCGPNRSSMFCWTFYIDAREPVVAPPSGAIVACPSQNIEVIFYRPLWLDMNNVVLIINDSSYTIADPRMAFDGISNIIRFSPTRPWRNGDSVICSLIFPLEPSLTTMDTVRWGFLMDYSKPVFTNAVPAPGAIVPAINPNISFTLIDSISGLMTSAFSLNVNGSAFGWTHPALSIVGNNFTLNTSASGLHIAGGDTARVCVHAIDFASPDYCGPNILDTCYSFFIKSGGPTATLISPFGTRAWGCDSLVKILFTDDDGINWSTLKILLNGVLVEWGDSRLSVRADTLIIAPRPTSGEAILVDILSLEDMLENSVSRVSWRFVFDFEPPIVSWIFPSRDTTLTTTSPLLFATAHDAISRMSVSPLPSMPFVFMRDTVALSPIGLMPMDTANICIIARDSAICPNIDTNCIRFFIDAVPPIADLIIPADSSLTACINQRVVILLTDPAGISPSGLLAVFGSDTVNLGDPRLRLRGDSLIFTPTTTFPEGLVFVAVLSARDRWGNTMPPFRSAFYQVYPPNITAVHPSHGTTSSTTTPIVSAVFDTNVSIGFFIIEGDTFIASISGDSIWFPTEFGGFSWSAGDTVRICAIGGMHADYCGPALAESCWSFYILYSPPTISVVSPTCGTCSSCPNQGMIFRLFASEGIDTMSIRFTANGDTFDIADAELSFAPVSGNLVFSPFSPWSEGSVEFCIIGLSDILGAEYASLPYCCEITVDLSPPIISIDPLPGTYLRLPLEDIEFTLSDGCGRFLAGASVEGIWIDTLDARLDWSDPIGVFDIASVLSSPVPDTITICARVLDGALYCPPNETTYCWGYSVNTTAPIINMIFPIPGSITSCETGPLVFVAIDPDGIDPLSTIIIINGDTIAMPDSRFSFFGDTIVFSPDSAWRHGASLSIAIGVSDPLGNFSGFFPFIIIIDNEPPRISSFYPPGGFGVLDTFSRMSFVAVDAPAGVDIISPIILVDEDTAYFIWRGDTCIIDTIRLGLCEFDTVVVSVRNLADLATGCGANVLPETSWSFFIIDDDISGPGISNISPNYFFNGSGFVVTANIGDPSGVFSATLYWSEGETLSSSPNAISMRHITGSVWASVDSIISMEAPFITIAICATDDDFDCANPLDRSMSCDTFVIPLFSLALEQIPIYHDLWNPEEIGADPLCVNERYISRVAFMNPDTIVLFADSIVLRIGAPFTISSWSDTALFPNETLFVNLVLFSSSEGNFSDTLLIFDRRISYPIGVDTIYARLRICDFYAGPNPISPNNDGFYDEFRIELPLSGDIEISFFRLEGFRVRTIRGSGRHYTWDGKDDHGVPQPPGIYLWVVRRNGNVYKHGSVTIAR